MLMLRLFLFVFGTIGLSHLLVDSKMFSWVKEWCIWSWINKWTFGWFAWVKDMLECYQCCGVWTGWFVALFTLTFWHVPHFMLDMEFSLFWGRILFNLPIVFFAGCAGSFLSYLAALFLSYLEAKTVIVAEKDE